MTTIPFAIPRDGMTYVASVRERCESLISSGVWTGLTISRLRRWCKNFQGETELYFAACLLDGLIYRSGVQTRALMEHLFQRSLPDVCRATGALPGIEDNWLDLLQRRQGAFDPGIRIVPVIRSSDPPTKSGPLLTRLYRQALNLDERWMIWPWSIQQSRSQGINTFLFVDDFLGTGGQFSEFCDQFQLARVLQGATTIYAPLVAHERGIETLKTTAPWVHTCQVELLDKSHCIFSNRSPIFQDEINTAEGARAFYFDLLRNRGFRLSKRFAAGWGHMALTYVFQHATPDNCIPLLWHEDANWSQLFSR